jgi:hypothetical protein
MAAIAYNLKKMLKFKTKRVMTAVLQLPSETDQVFTSLFLCTLFHQNSILTYKSKIHAVKRVINGVIHKRDPKLSLPKILLQGIVVQQLPLLCTVCLV